MRLLPLLLISLTVAACGDDEPTPSKDAGAECSIGAVSAEVQGPDGQYRTPPADAELILGFQGFRYVYMRFETDGVPADAVGHVVIELDGEAPLSQSFRLQLREGDPGVFTTDPLMVFFNDNPLPTLVGKDGSFTLHIGGDECFAETKGTFTMRYNPACIEGPDGERICSDGGMPDAGTDGDAG